MFCTNCGNKISKNDKFCTNCGQSISNSIINSPERFNIKKGFRARIFNNLFEVPTEFYEKIPVLYELVCQYFESEYDEPFYLTEDECILPISVLKEKEYQVICDESFEMFEELKRFNQIIFYKNYYILYFDLMKIVWYYRTKQLNNKSRY